MRKTPEKDLLDLNGPRNARRPKPEPRRKRRRRPIPPGVLLLRAFCGFVLLAVAFYTLTWALRPHCEAWLLQRDLAVIQRQAADAQNTRERLDWQMRYAKSPEGARSLSRDYGYVEKGEVPIVVPEGKALTSELPRPVEENLSLWDRVMLFACRVCRAGPEVVDRAGTGDRAGS